MLRRQKPFQDCFNVSDRQKALEYNHAFRGHQTARGVTLEFWRRAIDDAQAT
jgi:hypothetical protein